MKYALDIDIDRPRDEVVALFDDPDNLKHWQPGFLSFEPLAGTPGEPGAQSRLRYTMGKGELEMVETITERALPERFAGTYAAKGVENSVVNRFEELDGGARTRWHLESDFRFTTLSMKLMAKLMPGAFQKQSREFMERFKAFAESS